MEIISTNDQERVYLGFTSVDLLLAMYELFP